MVSCAVEDSFLRKIDNYVKKSGMYTSRSEFLKDSMRKNLVNMSDTEKWMKDFAKESIARGYRGGFPTREERAQIATDHLLEKGIIDQKEAKRLMNQKFD